MYQMELEKLKDPQADYTSKAKQQKDRFGVIKEASSKEIGLPHGKCDQNREQVPNFELMASRASKSVGRVDR